MADLRAFLDANVLFGNPSFDMLLSLAQKSYVMYQPLWNTWVLEELREHVAERLARFDHDESSDDSRVTAQSRIDRRIAAMRHAFPNAMVDMPENVLDDYPDSLVNDIDDKAIAVGAIIGKADLLITDNIKDFNVSKINIYQHLAVITCNDFLVSMFLRDKRLFYLAIRSMTDRHHRPPRNLRELCDVMARPGSNLRTLSNIITADVTDRYVKACRAMFSGRGVQGRDRYGRFTSIESYDIGVADLEPSPDEMWGPDGNGVPFDRRMSSRLYR